MNKQNIIYVVVFLVSLSICVAGIADYPQPIQPLEKMTSCVCSTECVQDFSKYGTINFFTAISHKFSHGECRACESVDERIREVCCKVN